MQVAQVLVVQVAAEPNIQVVEILDQPAKDIVVVMLVMQQAAEAVVQAAQETLDAVVAITMVEMAVQDYQVGLMASVELAAEAVPHMVVLQTQVVQQDNAEVATGKEGIILIRKLHQHLITQVQVAAEAEKALILEMAGQVLL
jgi:hypothetical protein